MRKLEADLATLSAPNAANLKQPIKGAKKITSRTTVPAEEEDSDFGDATELTPRELAEKAQRKKTLRFYTSQITQKANKRGAAGRDAGGNLDIPHRERFRERQAKAAEEAERRGKKSGKPTQDSPEDEDGDDTMAPTRANGVDDDDEDYYDMVAALSKQKKADKTAAAQAYAQAQKEGGRVIEEETIGEDGKRKITYAIDKNKGLTPFRGKVQNPRVKKRMKYKEKLKKLGSVRQVYKGGEGKGGEAS
jgi:U3 small nucleolar RNA-associated protein 3